MVKTIKLPTRHIDEYFGMAYDDIYTRQPRSRYEMVILDKKSMPIEESTDCKEEVGEMMVIDGFTKLVIDVTERFTNTEINGLLRRMHAHERSVGVKKKTDIQRVKYHSHYLYIEFSSRWSHSTVAHSIYLTWLRMKISEILGDSTWTDEDHLESADWIIKLVKAKGLGALGGHKHRKCTGGMVRVSEVMERGCFWWVNEEHIVGGRYFTPYSGMTKQYWKEFPALKEKWFAEQPNRYAY